MQTTPRRVHVGCVHFFDVRHAFLDVEFPKTRNETLFQRFLPHVVAISSLVYQAVPHPMRRQSGSRSLFTQQTFHQAQAHFDEQGEKEAKIKYDLLLEC